MCESSLKECQKFPKREQYQLGKNMNFELDELKDKLKEKQNPVYAYVAVTVEERAGEFCQTGCAPNFQGGRITLCTCKHHMRTWKEIKAAKGVWIAGFTSKTIMDGEKNYLFYLMRVEKTFNSFKEIWDLEPDLRTSKNAQTNFLGDLYEPKKNCKDEFDGSSYHKPRVHAHLKGDEWKWKDIEGKIQKKQNQKYVYVNREKKPALLLGSVEESFLWSKPIIFSNGQFGRATKKSKDLDSFIKTLVQVHSNRDC
jgi:hypothetical protein